MIIHPDKQQGYTKTIEVILSMHEDAYNDMLQKVSWFSGKNI
jgi:hypothetical protein